MNQLEGTFTNPNKPRKQARTNQGVVIEAINVVLSSALCGQCIIEEYSYYLDEFGECLGRICETGMLNLRNNLPIEIHSFTECCELWAVVQILRHNLVEFHSSFMNYHSTLGFPSRKDRQSAEENEA